MNRIKSKSTFFDFIWRPVIAIANHRNNQSLDLSDLEKKVQSLHKKKNKTQWSNYQSINTKKQERYSQIISLINSHCSDITSAIDIAGNQGLFSRQLLDRTSLQHVICQDLDEYAIDTGYGVLEWGLRNGEGVVMMERTNAMHVELPEKTDVITVDASWTKVEKIVPNALANLKEDGQIIALVKPHYEAHPSMLRKGRLQDESVSEVLDLVREKFTEMGVQVLQEAESPIVGGKGKNKEFLFHLKRV